MSTEKETLNRDLYDLLKVRGYKPVPLNAQNQRVKVSQESDIIEFEFNKDGKSYGKTWITIDDNHSIVVYYDNEQQDSPTSATPGIEYDDSWTGLLTQLKKWAQRRQLGFELRNKDRLGDDMRQRDYYKMKEKLGESRTLRENHEELPVHVTFDQFRNHVGGIMQEIANRYKNHEKSSSSSPAAPDSSKFRSSSEGMIKYVGAITVPGGYYGVTKHFSNFIKIGANVSSDIVKKIKQEFLDYFMEEFPAPDGWLISDDGYRLLFDSVSGSAWGGFGFQVRKPAQISEGRRDEFGYEIKGNKKPWGLYHTKPNKPEKLVSKHHNKNAAEAAKWDQIGMREYAKGEKFTVKKIPLVDEDVELNELSDNTLNSYKDKADKDMKRWKHTNGTSKEWHDTVNREVGNRTKGINTATRKLANKDVTEGYYPMGKKASYNDAVPNVKIILQHNRALEEGEARFRNVSRIFLENAEGERFLAPTTRPGIARVYARHIAEGGIPNDDRWNHIKSICEDYNKMAGFVRATKNGQFNESTQQLVNEGAAYYTNLRETLHKLAGHKGYHAYFESWTPSLMEGEGEDISEMFMSSSMDPRIEAAMPILSRLKTPVTEMEEVDHLAEWADEVINEKLELNELSSDTVERYQNRADKEAMQAHRNSKFKSSDGAIDGSKHKKKFKQRVKGLDMAAKKLGGNAKVPVTGMAEATDKQGDEYKKWRKKNFNDKKTTDDIVTDSGTRTKYDIDEKFIGITPQAVGEATSKSNPVFKRIDDYAAWHDDYVMRIGAEYDETEIDGKLIGVAWTNKGVRGLWYNQARFGTISSVPIEDELVYAETDPNSPWLNEGLDRNQQRVGQLGPTEKVKNNNIGKLVGACESTEYDPLISLIELTQKMK